MNLVELSFCFLPFLGLVAGVFLGNGFGGAIGFIAGWLLLVSAVWAAGKFTKDIDRKRNKE
jgi:hypothetical protein